MGVVTPRLKTTAAEAREAPDQCAVRGSSPEKEQWGGLCSAESCGVEHGGWSLGDQQGSCQGVLEPQEKDLGHSWVPGEASEGVETGRRVAGLVLWEVS